MRFDYVNLFDENLKVIPHVKWSNDIETQDLPVCHYDTESSTHTVVVNY